MRFEEADILLSVSGVLEGGRVGGPQRKGKKTGLSFPVCGGDVTLRASLCLCVRGVWTHESRVSQQEAESC